MCVHGSGRREEVAGVLAGSRIGGSRNSGKPYCWGNLKTRWNLAALQTGSRKQWPLNLKRRIPGHPGGGGRTCDWPEANVVMGGGAQGLIRARTS